MSTDLFVVDASKLNKPAPCDLRSGAMLQREHRIKVESVALYSASSKASAGEVQTLSAELASAEKAVKALSKVGTVPANVAAKLDSLRGRLSAAERNADVQVRILASKKMELERWLGEGDPTNASLCESDGLLDKALDAVRRTVGL
jgi:hypothetical protein